MKPVRLGDEAEAAAADRYDAQRPGLKADFLTVVRDVLDTVSEFPASGAALRVRGHAAALVRRHLVPRFPFAVIYVDDDEVVVVIAFAHTHRKPHYWKDRVSQRRS